MLLGRVESLLEPVGNRFKVSGEWLPEISLSFARADEYYESCNAIDFSGPFVLEKSFRGLSFEVNGSGGASCFLLDRGRTIHPVEAFFYSDYLLTFLQPSSSSIFSVSGDSLNTRMRFSSVKQIVKLAALRLIFRQITSSGYRNSLGFPLV